MMRIKLRHAPIVAGTLLFVACSDDSTPALDTDASSSSSTSDPSTMTEPDPDSTTTSGDSADSSTSAGPTTTTTNDTTETTTGTGDCLIPIAIVDDGSFEGGAGNSPWGEASSAFGTPLCDMGSCGADNAQDGAWYVWLGGANTTDVGGVSQEVTVPDVDGLEMTFYFWLGGTGDGGNVFQLQVDGDVLWEVTDADAAEYGEYTQVTIDMSAYADGGDHDIDFTGIAAAGANLFLDNVVLEACGEGGSLTEGDTVDAVMTGATTDSTTDSTTDTGGTLECEDLGNALPIAQDGNNMGAGDDYEPSCTVDGGGDGNDVGYTWTAPQAGTYRIDTLGSPLDSVLVVLDGCAADANEIACNDDFGGTFQSAVTVTLEADQTIAVVVDGWDPNAVGDYTLNINQIACEDPDDLGNNEPIELDDDNTGAGDDVAASCGGAGGEDVIYVWEAPDDGLYSVYAVSLQMAPVVSAYAGTCGNPDDEIACGAGQNLASFTSLFTAGQQVTIVVDGAGATESGAYELNIESAGTLSGDCCAPDASAGCESFDVTACVCNGADLFGFDPSGCCSGEWDSLCAGYAASQCAADANCDLTPGGSCCDGDSGNPGCDTPAVETCVCDLVASCCDTDWDAFCVDVATNFCFAEC